MLLEVVEMFRQHGSYSLVEPAHMEIARPSLQDAFDQCVQKGARSVLVFPYFLLPGRHWKKDIPALAEQAAARHPGVPYLVTAPLAVHPLMARIMQQRMEHCQQYAAGKAEACEVCRGDGDCGIRTAATNSG